MVKVGQIWREVDRRFSRHVRIEAVGEGFGKALICTINPETGQKCGPFTQARLSRFNGKSGGYTIVLEAARRDESMKPHIYLSSEKWHVYAPPDQGFGFIFMRNAFSYAKGIWKRRTKQC
ncbi:hypothetical protein AWB78_01322 [Caballeronia calidae]|uniref:Uncharacterized protein n=2 Tax=Caballeronia calidae TaxID=1777139 RepID=A0A158A6J8_9BURK|nr:hypothetical protein AWB78_01322 [Caballeronia calidae]